jgi:hypothetical protein
MANPVQPIHGIVSTLLPFVIAASFINCGLCDEPKTEPPKEIPQKIREYFERTDIARETMNKEFEKQIGVIEIQMNSSASGKRLHKKKIAEIEKSIDELKKTTVTAFMPAWEEVAVGDIGAFLNPPAIEAIIDDKTLAIGKNPGAVITPIKTKGLKVGQPVPNAELFRATATRDARSPWIYDEKLQSLGVTVLNVYEPLKKADVEKYRQQYEDEKAKAAKPK